MRYAEYLKQLLLPLGVYDLNAGTLNEAELYALGAQLDRVAEQLEHAEQEALLATAEQEGLARWETLLPGGNAAQTVLDRRSAIWALLQIDGDSLTPEAIDRAILGCGLPAKAVEVDTGHLQVIFPGISGPPAGFEAIEKLILEILPCHLEVEFYFRYVTWAELEAQNVTWDWTESNDHTWVSFEMLEFT